MNSLKEFFESRQAVLWIETQNTVAFLRPVPDILVSTPCPTACLAESLRLRQIGLAPPQGLLRAFAVGEIAGDAAVAGKPALCIKRRLAAAGDDAMYPDVAAVLVHA